MLLNRISFICLLVNFTLFAAFNTASDYFNAASQTYIIDNNVKSAKKYIADGLAAFPNDEKLKKLASYIKEEEKKQDQQNKDQQNKDQQNKDQQNKDQQNKDQQNKDQQNKDQQNKDQQNKDQNQQDNQENEDQKQEQQQQQAQQNESKQDMKKEEAKRLIELYADDADSLNKPQKKANASKGKFQKDW
jgi:hypothetical protein